MKRVFLIVLDSLGIGEEPDAPLFLDKDCNTLKRISGSDKFRFESMRRMGVGNIDGQDYLPKEKKPLLQYNIVETAEKTGRIRFRNGRIARLPPLVCECALTNGKNGCTMNYLKTFSLFFGTESGGFLWAL